MRLGRILFGPNRKEMLSLTDPNGPAAKLRATMRETRDIIRDRLTHHCEWTQRNIRDCPHGDATQVVGDTAAEFFILETCKCGNVRVPPEETK